MTKKSQSRATKMVLASLLAASLSLPAVASASTISASTNAAAVIEASQIIDFHVYKSGTTEPQPAITSHMAPQGTLVQKDGKTVANLTILAKSAAMITGVQTKQGTEFVNATEVKNADGTTTYSFPVDTTKVYAGKMHVVVPAHNMDKWYDFDFKTEVAKKDTDVVVAEKMDVKVYKNGTKEESIMKSYMSSTVSVVKNATTNIVTMTFPKGGYIHGFKVEGKDVKIASEDKATGERTYNFDVADLTKLANAEIHVIVDEAGIKYDSNHKVQFGFAAKGIVTPPVTPSDVVNPFKDIEKDSNKAAILSLYGKGVVKSGEKFNPHNNITRAEFALMVARALDLKTTKSAGFKDLGTNAERLSAVNALAEAGIVRKAAKFNPNNTLTRQEGALMLYRALNFKAGKELTGKDTTLKFYADGVTVSNPETKKALALLYDTKIMTGSKNANGKSVIKANDPLQRTQMAKILNGSLEHMNK